MESAVTGEGSKLASPEEVNYLSLERSQDQVTCIIKQRFFAFGHFFLKSLTTVHPSPLIGTLCIYFFGGPICRCYMANRGLPKTAPIYHSVGVP